MMEPGHETDHIAHERYATYCQVRVIGWLWDARREEAAQALLDPAASAKFVEVHVPAWAVERFVESAIRARSSEGAVSMPDIADTVASLLLADLALAEKDDG